MEGRKYAKIITIIKHTSHSSVPSLVAPRWQCLDNFLLPCPVPMSLDSVVSSVLTVKHTNVPTFFHLDETFEIYLFARPLAGLCAKIC